MAEVEVIKGPQLKWEHGQETAIEVTFRLCEAKTRSVRFEWFATTTSGEHVSGVTDRLPLDRESCVAARAVVPAEDLTALLTLRDAEQPEAPPLWQGKTYISVAGYEPTLVPEPAEPLTPLETARINRSQPSYAHGTPRS